MPVITSIKPQRNGKRVNIYLDGKFGFGLDLENYVRLQLKVNQELTEEKVEEIIKKAELQTTWDKLVKFATLRPRSEKEVEDYFRRKKVHASLHLELFNRLKRLELVDDMKFTQWWVGQRSTFKPRGKTALRMELKQKGIKRETIDEVLQETMIDEYQLARELLTRNAYKWVKDAPQEKKQKQAQFLARKGFTWEVIDQAGD